MEYDRKVFRVLLVLFKRHYRLIKSKFTGLLLLDKSRLGLHLPHKQTDEQRAYDDQCQVDQHL